mgnify:CR=1 FL=1
MNNQRGFTGISFPFRFDGRGGVATSTTSINDFSHIEESIKQIVLTSIKERVMELEFGSNVRDHLFSMTDDETDIAILKFHIREAIEKFEKRVEIEDINILKDETEVGEGTWIVEIKFKVIRYLKNSVVRFKLK